MLSSLEIRDMLLIDRLELTFRPGLNALTGETGAGKSILLDALGFALGWRGRAVRPRAGAAHGEVTAVFDIAANPAARKLLEEAGLAAGDELLLHRSISSEGRRTLRINDRRASVETLRALADCLVSLHGQQDDRGLLDASGHRRILDGFAGLTGDVQAVRQAWQAWRQAREDLEVAQAALEQARREEDYLRHAHDELERLDPQPDEEASLDARRRLMRAAAKIGEDVSRALAAIGPEGAEGRLADALRWIESAAGAAEERLDPVLAALGRALDETAEAQAGIERMLEALAFEPAELERLEERLFALRALARKHGVSPGELPALRGELARRLAALEGSAEDLDRLRRALQEAETAHARAAGALHERRCAAAARLDEAMARELAPLKLEHARFCTLVSPTEPGPEGCDSVVFHVATSPGAPAGPLNRIASGGELSRFLLALRVCLRAGQGGRVMIFDEIDRGVGGATADAVGRRLERLAGAAQVLVVTHAPQVAARAAHHWRVEKQVRGGETFSRVVPLSAEARIDEIARMLAGDTVTDAARAAARALLAG